MEPSQQPYFFVVARTFMVAGVIIVATLQGETFEVVRWKVGFWGFAVLFMAAMAYGQHRLLLWRRQGPGVPGRPGTFTEYWYSVLAPRLLRIMAIGAYIQGLAIVIPVLVWAGR